MDRFKFVITVGYSLEVFHGYGYLLWSVYSLLLEAIALEN